jgi:hypothetical protein
MQSVVVTSDGCPRKFRTPPATAAQSVNPNQSKTAASIPKKIGSNSGEIGPLLWKSWPENNLKTEMRISPNAVVPNREGASFPTSSRLGPFPFKHFPSGKPGSR